MNLGRWVVWYVVFSVVLGLALTAGLVYVLAHFVAKWW